VTFKNRHESCLEPIEKKLTALIHNALLSWYQLGFAGRGNSLRYILGRLSIT